MTLHARASSFYPDNDLGLTIDTASTNRAWNPNGLVRYGGTYGKKGAGMKPALNVSLGR